MGTTTHAAGRRLRAALVALVLMTLAACSPGASAPSSGQDATVRLAIGATAEPPNLDPMSAPAAAGSQALLYNTYETLVKLGPGGELQPLLAQAWDVSSDRLVYTFPLNPAAKFADGDAVTADAVVKNLERIRDTAVADSYGTTVAPKLKSQMSVVAKVEAADERTVKVTLSHPSNAWLYEMSSTAGMIANPKSFGTLATASAGSGPLQVKGWNKGDSIVLEKNPNYWGTPSRFDEVTFKYYADPNAMNAAMLAGQLDMISNLQAPDTISQFADPTRFTTVEGTTNGEVVLGLNNARKALKDVKVRRAIAMAIDKQALVDTVWNGKGQVIGTMAVPTDPYYEDLSAVNGYDPEGAKKLLKEAGYGDGLKLKFKPAALPYATKSAQFIASQLAEVGIDCEIEELQFPNRWSEVVYGKGDYDLSIVAHVEARDLVTYTNPDYYWHYKSAQFNKLYAAADQAPPAEYPEEMKKAARYLADDAASVWLFVLPNLVITKSNVTGVSSNAASLSFDTTTIAVK